MNSVDQDPGCHKVIDCYQCVHCFSMYINNQTNQIEYYKNTCCNFISCPPGIRCNGCIRPSIHPFVCSIKALSFCTSEPQTSFWGVSSFINLAETSSTKLDFQLHVLLLLYAAIVPIFYFDRHEQANIKQSLGARSVRTTLRDVTPTSTVLPTTRLLPVSRLSASNLEIQWSSNSQFKLIFGGRKFTSNFTS